MATATKKFPPDVFSTTSCPGTRAVAVRVRSVRTHDRRDLSLPGLAETGRVSISRAGGDAGLRDVFRVVVWRGGGAAVHLPQPGFAVLLAFLGMNILCAALIRYPWKKRQTGFVVTHAGLLTLLLGSYYSVRTADEGQVGMLEGDVKSELVRIDYPVIRVLEIDPHTRRADSRDRSAVSSRSVRVGAGKTAIRRVFSPGLFRWSRSGSWVVGFHRRGLDASRATRSGSWSRSTCRRRSRRCAHVADPAGAPMVRMGLQFKGPGMPQAQDAFRSEEDHWFATEREVLPGRPQPAAGACWHFPMSTVPSWSTTSSSRRPIPGPRGVARFRYPDRSGKTRVFDWALDGQEGKSVGLPESDLTVTLSQATEFPTEQHRARADPGRRLDSDRQVRDPGRQGRASHPHGAGQPADGPQRDSSARTRPRKPRRARWRRSTTW